MDKLRLLAAVIDYLSSGREMHEEAGSFLISQPAGKHRNL
jgi:hypothetical protein